MAKEKKLVCKKCGECCTNKFELFILNLPEMAQTRALIKDAVEKGFSLEFKHVNDISVTVYGVCKHYNKKEKRCMIYNKRPKRCRLFYCGRYTE